MEASVVQRHHGRDEGIGSMAGSLVFRSQDAPAYFPGIYATIT
jgi:hypothetical protein